MNLILIIGFVLFGIILVIINIPEKKEKVYKTIENACDICNGTGKSRTTSSSNDRRYRCLICQGTGKLKT